MPYNVARTDDVASLDTLADFICLWPNGTGWSFSLIMVILLHSLTVLTVMFSQNGEQASIQDLLIFYVFVIHDHSPFWIYLPGEIRDSGTVALAPFKRLPLPRLPWDFPYPQAFPLPWPWSWQDKLANLSKPNDQNQINIWEAVFWILPKCYLG